jgi:biofilm protein TabA
MIIDSMENADKYYALNPFFEKAFDYIRNADLEGIAAGKYDIDGDYVRAIISAKPGMSAAESILKFECHNKHIDIQYCINGKETIGWKPRASCLAPKGDYNADKDVLLFNDVPDTYFSLTNGQFAIFYPEDVHAPMIGEEEIRKLVIKVRI